MTEDKFVWITMFQSIYGWQFHPGKSRDGTPVLTMEDCGKLADLALAIYKEKFPCGESVPF